MKKMNLPKVNEMPRWMLFFSPLQVPGKGLWNLWISLQSLLLIVQWIKLRAFLYLEFYFNSNLVNSLTWKEQFIFCMPWSHQNWIPIKFSVSEKFLHFNTVQLNSGIQLDVFGTSVLNLLWMDDLFPYLWSVNDFYSAC